MLSRPWRPSVAALLFGRAEAGPLPAQQPPAANPRLLADISAVGDLVGDFATKGSTQPDSARFDVRELALAVQGAVDPAPRRGFPGRRHRPTRRGAAFGDVPQWRGSRTWSMQALALWSRPAAHGRTRGRQRPTARPGRDPAATQDRRTSHDDSGEGNETVLVFGSPDAPGTAPLAPPVPAENYIYFKGGTIRFGKLYMVLADLFTSDAEPTDPFDFYLDYYHTQLAAGYHVTMPNQELVTYMPDFEDIGASQRSATRPTVTN